MTLYFLDRTIYNRLFQYLQFVLLEGLFIIKVWAIKMKIWSWYANSIGPGLTCTDV
jgi:hypothetical protein